MAADNLDSPTFGDFSIQNTMEMSSGSQELLDSLYSPDTVTASSDEVEVIDNKPKKKVTTTAETTTKKVEKPKEDPSKVITSFLTDEEEEEEEEGDEPEATTKKKVEKTEGQENEEGDEADENENASNPFSSISKELFKLGVFNKEEEEEEEVDINTGEQLLERFKSEKQKGAIEIVDRFIGQFGEEYQNAFQAIFVKGVNPKEYFGAYNNIQDFSALDLTITSNQVAVVTQVLVDQGFEPDDAAAEIERLTNNGDLETVAQRHHKVLIKKEAAKIASLEQQSQERLSQQATIKNQYIKNVQTILQDKVNKKEFDGIPLNPKLAGELQDFLITDKYKTPSGETLTEFDRTILDLKRPENHEKKIKVALLMKILEKDPTLSTIQKAGVTKKSDALFSDLARQTGKSTVKNDKTKAKPSSWFS
jgi:hypothetical protein